MASTRELIAFLDELLDPGSYADHCPNGLQVPGPDTVTTVVTGVSAHQALFDLAVAEGADLVLVHHGLFWDGTPRALDRPAARRLGTLLRNDIALAAYHLPLDGHPVHGNSALLAEALGAVRPEPFAPHRGTPIGVAAQLPGDGITPDELLARVRAATGGREPLAFLDGPRRIRSIGVVSGSAADSIHDAIGAGLDAFITGEPAERVMAVARENDIHFLAAGHHATERGGVRRLGELLAAQFGVRHVFVDVPNPI